MTNDVGLKVSIGSHSLSFIDVGQDAWAQNIRANRTDHLETTSILAWSALTENARVAVDVGGFNGLYAMVAAKSGAYRSFCFEPVSLSYGVLVLNLRLNGLDGAVCAVNCALGDVAGRALINSQSGPYVMASGETLLEDWPYHTPVEVQRFDDIWAGDIDTLSWPASTFVGTVDAIKIDVEGFELNVLEGMKSVIFADDKRPHILVELLTHQAVAQFIRALPRDYVCYRVFENELEIRPLSAHDAPREHGGNFLFTTLAEAEFDQIKERVKLSASSDMWNVFSMLVGNQTTPGEARTRAGADSALPAEETVDVPDCPSTALPDAGLQREVSSTVTESTQNRTSKGEA